MKRKRNKSGILTKIGEVNFTLFVGKGYNRENPDEKVQADHFKQVNIHLLSEPKVMVLAGFPYNPVKIKDLPDDAEVRNIQFRPLGNGEYLLIAGHAVIDPAWGVRSLTLDKGIVKSQWMFETRYDFPFYRPLRPKEDKYLYIPLKGRVISSGTILFKLLEPFWTKYVVQKLYRPDENTYRKDIKK